MDLTNKLPSLPKNYPTGGPTIRATTLMCEVDGGAFLLLLSDLRPIAEYAHAERFEGRSGFVEVGRFVLSPMAFLQLKEQMRLAEEYYASHFGPMPDVAEQTRRIYNELPERRVEAAQRIGFRPDQGDAKT